MTGLVATVAVFLLFGCVQSRSLYGTFGLDTVPVEVTFGKDTMVARFSSPVNPNPYFRPTTNMHDFSWKLVAMKSDAHKQCYVQGFVEPQSELKGRVMNAEYTNGEIGNLVEEQISIDGLTPLPQMFYPVLGPKITDFCEDYEVYILSDLDTYPHTPEDFHRKKRSAPSFDVARVCDKEQ